MNVVIVGKTNAGKSTLFNKIIGKNYVLTSKIKGTTRDINKKETEWNGVVFDLIDTAGIDIEPRDDIEKAVAEQSLKQIKSADLIILLLEASTELLPQEKEIIKTVRKTAKPVILSINKVDNQNIRKKIDIYELENLGFGKPQLISASSGMGVGDLLDKVVEKINEIPNKKSQTKRNISKLSSPEIKVAIIGKPNVGKSSFLNALLKRKIPISKQEKLIVTPIAHTTREPQERKIKDENYIINFIDTAGIRKKSKIKQNSLEKISVRKSVETIKNADIVLFMVDVSDYLGTQDKKLAGLIEKNNKGLIIIGNKWDLIQNKDINTYKKFENYFKKTFPAFTWAPIFFISAKEGKNVLKIYQNIETIYKERLKEIKEEELNIFIKKTVKLHPPAKAKGPKPPKIYGIKQSGTNPPQFTIIIGPKDTLHFSYLRFIKNKLREEFGFLGTPIKLNTQKLSPKNRSGN